MSPAAEECSPQSPTAGASAACFATTHWMVVLTARGDSPESAAALEQLCQTYWYPLYAYVRRWGSSPHDAQDLTQAFFAELFRKNYLQAADRRRGKFRSFLLTALRHFLAHQWEKDQAQKRGGGVAAVALDEEVAENQYRQESGVAGTPERLYDRNWAMRVFAQALARLRLESVEQGHAAQFEQLKDYLAREPAPGAYAATAAKLGLSPNSVAVTVHRLRQRYATLVRELVARTVAQPEQVEEELSYLISLVCE